MALLSLFGVSFGCASLSPFNQEFVEVRTPNFWITSSLGEAETRGLARDLEVFHAGVVFALGLEAEEAETTAPREPTRVLAFDDRGVTRPFAVRGAAASWVPGVDASMLVIRRPGRLDENVGGDLRHRYAHRVLRDRSQSRPPLWYEEGRALIVRTLELEPTGVRVGRSDPVLREKVNDWRLSRWRNVFEKRDLAGLSAAERDLFEAQAWALVHTALFDSKGGAEGVRSLDGLRRALDSGDGATVGRLTHRLGSDAVLEERIYDHLQRDRHRVERLRVGGMNRADLDVRPLAIGAARTRLGELALALARPALAADYFERALEEEGREMNASDAIQARAGTGHAAALLGEEVGVAWPKVASLSDFSAAESWGWAALAEAETDVEAESSSRVGAGRGLDRAREFFRGSLALRPGRAGPHLGLAQVEIRPGGDFDVARQELAEASRLAPGALEIDYPRARLEGLAGRPRVAKIHLGEVLSRSHAPDLRRRAGLLLETVSGG